MLELIPLIQEHVLDIYNPNGNKVFAIAFQGAFSGVILSESVAMLTNKDDGQIFLTHPNLIGLEYEEPIIAITAKEGHLNLSRNYPRSSSAENPEIEKLWEKIQKFVDGKMLELMLNEG